MYKYKVRYFLNLLVGVSTQMRFTHFCCFGASKVSTSYKSRHSFNVRITAPRAPATVQNPVSLKSESKESSLICELSVLSLHLTAKHKVIQIIIIG